MPAVAQGRLGKVSIGGTLYPCYGWQLFSPRNIQAGLPIGNTWSTAYGEGLQSSLVRVQFMPKLTGAVLTTAFFDLFLARTFGSNFDDTSANTLIVSSGANVRTLANAKAESFTVRVSKGAVVGLEAVFLAPGKPAYTTQAIAAYPTPDPTTNLLMFDAVSLAGFSGGASCYDAMVSFSNNHLPNAPLDGTKLVSSWEAGPRTASATFRFAEFSSVPIAEATPITINLNGAITLNLTRCIPNDPDDASVGVGQVYRPVNCQILGDQTNPPVYRS